MSRATREQRIRSQLEQRAAQKNERMRHPSGKSSYAIKKELQKMGRHPKVTDPLKGLPPVIPQIGLIDTALGVNETPRPRTVSYFVGYG